MEPGGGRYRLITMTTSLRRSGARPQSVLASAALALLLGTGLAGCGEQDSDTAADPQSSSTPTQDPTTTQDSATPTEDPEPVSGASLPVTGGSGVTEATLVSATEAGGSASTLAMTLDTELARTDFVAQFETGFAATVLDELDAQEPVAGATPYGTVVAVGCDAPESVAIEAGEAGFEVTASLPKETVQCFAPMTFVVLFSAPGA